MAVLHRHWTLAVLWVLSLIVVGVTSSLAQAPRARPEAVTEAPTVIFGDDVGFRLERTRDGMAIGKVVVRVDGRWVDTTAR
jgi:hypothetical protein